MIRRDFIKLVATALAATTIPGKIPGVPVRPLPVPPDLDQLPLEILLLSVSARILAKGTSRPTDGEHGAIEFDVLQTGEIKVVVVSNLDTGKEIVRLYPGGEISFNSTYVCAGDSVRIQGLST